MDTSTKYLIILMLNMKCTNKYSKWQQILLFFFYFFMMKPEFSFVKKKKVQ